jgi:hypothetical protein
MTGGIHWSYLNMVKTINDQLIPNGMMKSFQHVGNLKLFPLKLRMWEGCSLRAINQEKEIKGIALICIWYDPTLKRLMNLGLFDLVSKFSIVRKKNQPTKWTE